MENNKQGMFITIEGVEGAGKSTAMQLICNFLQQQQCNFVTTREPGGTEIAEAIREVLLRHYNEKMLPETELLLFFAGRAQHIERVIKPNLRAGKIVLCDRFTDASYAYQGEARGIATEHVAMLENFVQGDLRPDLTIILDVSPEIGLARAKKCNELDRIEVEELEFFRKVRGYYLAQAERFPERYVVLNAEEPIASVEQQLQKILSRLGLGPTRK